VGGWGGGQSDRRQRFNRADCKRRQRWAFSKSRHTPAVQAGPSSLSTCGSTICVMCAAVREGAMRRLPLACGSTLSAGGSVGCPLRCVTGCRRSSLPHAICSRLLRRCSLDASRASRLRAASAWISSWWRSVGTTLGSTRRAGGPPPGLLRARATKVR
jgi:hypothetical protein